MKYFYVNNKKFNYILEFDIQNSKNNWKINATLIEYFETLNIIVPHYCYHKNLSIAGNCRMCLIELKKSPKPIVSCAISAKSSLMNKSEIFTNSPLVKKARENILEFLLLNHPLDCPICDQGGECDLQDQSFFFGINKKRFYGFKRIIINKNISPVIKTVMSRCIHCTRCVRFAKEVANFGNLNSFGRGKQNEIGTFINQIFQSEFSANIIDICPVGALTSKIYPFVGRNWELKKIISIDFSDGFAANTQVFLKNNKIVKILSSHSSQNEINNLWISDKTRFIFDGMFSLNRNVNIFSFNNSKKVDSFCWNKIFKKLTIILYFLEHLEKHYLKLNLFLIVFSENSSIEVINILMTLAKRYSFFQLRRTINLTTVSNDFEQNFQINYTNFFKKLLLSKICLLFGTNFRYESSYLNLKLKKRFTTGGFKVLSIGAKNNLTFPAVTVGSNFNSLKSILGGNSSVCKNLTISQKPSAFTNTEIFYRKDSSIILSLFQTVDKIYSNKKWTIFNLTNTSLNSVGVSVLNSFKTLSSKDLNKNINGIYYINNDIKTLYLNNKLIDLELLNYSRQKKKGVLIEQNNQISFFTTKTNLNILNYIYLPNQVFFENSYNFINTQGESKKTTKLISSLKSTKNDWQIIRKLIANLKRVRFMKNNKFCSRINYKCVNLFNFKNLVSFLFLNTKNLSKISFCLHNNNQAFKQKRKQKVKKTKFYKTQLKNWINDFYLGGFDNYSKNSKIMIYSSVKLKTINSTFIFIT